MNRQPFNDDPGHVPVKPFRPEMIIGFINFHRRFIIGTLLLLGVAYLLVRLNYPDLVGVSSVVSATDEGDFDTRTEIAVVSPSFEFGEPIKSPSLLTVDEEVDELLNTDGEWNRKSPSVKVEMLRNRLGKLKNLLANQHLEPSHRSYCEHSYLDAVGILVGVSGKSTVGVARIDEMVGEVDKLFGSSENKAIAAKANAVFLRHALSQFLETRSDDHFEGLKNALQTRRDAISNSELASAYVTKIFSEAIVVAGDDLRLRKMAIEHLSRNIDQTKIVLLDLTRNIFFAGIDLKTLPKRLLNQDSGADKDMELLFEQLKKHPDMPVPIYSTAATSIQASTDGGQHEMAQRYLDKLREIAPLITVAAIREQVYKGIDMIKVPSQPESDADKSTATEEL